MCAVTQSDVPPIVSEHLHGFRRHQIIQRWPVERRVIGSVLVTRELDDGVTSNGQGFRVYETRRPGRWGQQGDTLSSHQDPGASGRGRGSRLCR